MSNVAVCALLFAALFGPFIVNAALKRTRVWWVPSVVMLAAAITWLALPHEARHTIGEAGPDAGLLVEYGFVIATGVIWLVLFLVGAFGTKRPSKATRKPNRARV